MALNKEQEKERPVLATAIQLSTAYWPYLLLFVVGVLLLGFFVGKIVTEASIRKRFHGIKVW